MLKPPEVLRSPPRRGEAEEPRALAEPAPGRGSGASSRLVGVLAMGEKPSFREVRYTEKRARILETAARLFARKGYENVTLEEIAASLKLTRASLYYYVRSKDQIFFEIQMQAIEQGQQALDEVLAAESDPVERLKKVISNHVRIVTRDHIIGTFRQRELVLPPSLMKRVVAARDSFERSFENMIREGVEAGAFNPRHWKVAVKLLLSTLNGIPRWYSPRGELSPDEISEALASLILDGFGAGRGDLESGGPV